MPLHRVRAEPATEGLAKPGELAIIIRCYTTIQAESKLIHHASALLGALSSGHLKVRHQALLDDLKKTQLNMRTSSLYIAGPGISRPPFQVTKKMMPNASASPAAVSSDSAATARRDRAAWATADLAATSLSPGLPAAQPFPSARPPTGGKAMAKPFRLAFSEDRSCCRTSFHSASGQSLKLKVLVRFRPWLVDVAMRRAPAKASRI